MRKKVGVGKYRPVSGRITKLKQVQNDEGWSRIVMYLIVQAMARTRVQTNCRQELKGLSFQKEKERQRLS